MSQQARKHEPIWVTSTTFEELLQVADYFMEKDGKTRNQDDVIKELVAFWKRHR